MNSKLKWHTFESDKIFHLLNSTTDGLSELEAKKRVLKDGLNNIPRTNAPFWWVLLLRQFQNPLMYIVLIAGGISLFLKHYSDTVFIFIVILINVLVGFYQERKADRSLRALEKMVRIEAEVKRGGRKKKIDASELSIGDIIFLGAGDKVPADCRLLEVNNFSVNEATLTGEFVPVNKITQAIKDTEITAEKNNMVFMGTIVESGTGVAIVVSRGLQTEFGKVVSLMREVRPPKTPLQKKLETISKIISIVVLFSIVLISIIGLVEGRAFGEIFITAIALIISVIPEGLLPAITVVLVIGMRRIFKKNGLVRRLSSAETLGSVSVICTDKTGTLTEGKMSISHILSSDKELFATDLESFSKDPKQNGIESHIKALEIAIFSNDAFVENPEAGFEEWIIRGTPTEIGILKAGMQAGLYKSKLEEKYPRIYRLPFDSHKKFSASLNEMGKNKFTLFSIGAPEIIIERSVKLESNKKIISLTKDRKDALKQKLDELTNRGLRVIASAKKNYRESKDTLVDDDINDLTLVGFIALKDPLRPDAKSTVKKLEGAGVKTVLITGDHLNTAKAIAEEVGIPFSRAKLGSEIRGIKFEELKKIVSETNVYARVSPEDKLNIIKALSDNQEVVAMIGDGVNDAPAIRLAHIGISVGSGTDVAKEASDLILLNDSLQTVLSVIEQGRLIFDNVRKITAYLLADDFSEIFIFFMSVIFGLPLPLLPAQILWINFVEDGAPDIALTAESETKGLLEQKPRKISTPIIDKPLRNWLISIFFIAGSTAFLMYFVSLLITDNLEYARTATFVLMCIDSLALTYSIRSFNLPIWRKNIFNNKILTGATIFSFGLLILAVYLPGLNKLLDTYQIGVFSWLLILSISFVEIYIVEVFKKRFFTQH